MSGLGARVDRLPGGGLRSAVAPRSCSPWQDREKIMHGNVEKLLKAELDMRVRENPRAEMDVGLSQPSLMRVRK